jgi:hypothetical protein
MLSDKIPQYQGQKYHFYLILIFLHILFDKKKDYLLHLKFFLLNHLHLIRAKFFIFIIINSEEFIKIIFLIKFFQVLVYFLIDLKANVRFNYLVILFCFHTFLKLFIDQFILKFF